MKRFIIALALLCAGLPSFAQSTIVAGTNVKDNSGNLLASGQWCFGASCSTVTSGAFSGSVTSGTGTITIVNGATTYLTIPGATVAGSYFSWNTYVVPSSASIAGLGVPYIACTPGAVYTQTDGALNQWQCMSINGAGSWNGVAPQPTIVSKIVAGSNVTISPSGGTGTVTISAPAPGLATNNPTFTGTLSGPSANISGTVVAGGETLSSPVNVMQYGAQCDGVTDDTAALTAAFQAESSLIFPPDRTCVVASYINYSTNVTVGTLNLVPLVDLNGSTILFTGTGNSIISWSASTPVSLGTVVISSGRAQVVTTAGTTGSSTPAWNNTWAASTTDGTAVWTNSGLAPYQWIASTRYYFGEKVTDGTYLYQVSVTGVTGSTMPMWNTAAGITTTDGTASWVNLGPGPTNAGCSKGVNGLLRLKTQILLKNGTLTSNNTAATCIINFSGTGNAFVSAMYIDHVAFSQLTPAGGIPTVLTNTDAISSTYSGIVTIRDSKFRGSLGRAISCGDMGQLAGTDECDEWNIHSNFLAQEVNAYPKWAANTAVTLGAIYAGDTSYAVQVTTAGTTDSSSPSWPTTPGGTVTSGTAVFTTLATPARYDPLIYIFSPQHASIKDNYVEYGPYVSSETTVGNSDQLTVDGMWGGDADPPYWVHFEGDVANISNVWAYNPAANTTYTNDISVVASNSCSITGNSFSKSSTGIYSRCSGSNGAGIISGNKISGSTVGIDIGGNTTVTGNYVGGNRGIAVNGTNNFIGPNAFTNTGSDGGMVYCFIQSNMIFGSTVDPSCTAAGNNIQPSGGTISNILMNGYLLNTGAATTYTPSLTQQASENWGTYAGAPDFGCNVLSAGGGITLTSKMSLSLCGGSGSQKLLELFSGTTPLMYVSGTGAVAWEKAGAAYTVTGATATIAPLQMVSSVGGTGTLQTITTPASFTSSTAGCLTFLPTNTWNTTASGGNIANVITAIINVPVFACWNGASWYMSTTPATYVLPTATSTTLGGVKPDGTTLTNTGGALSVTYGTTAATAAQGNDSRITGAVQTGGSLGTPSSGVITNLTGTCTTCAANATTNALTMNNSGTGAASGTTFNGSSPQTISYNTIGAQQALTLTTTGTSGPATLSSGTLNIPQYSGGGSSAFSSLTGGTNTTAAMLVGAGASIGTTSTGINQATSVNGTSSTSSVVVQGGQDTSTSTALGGITVRGADQNGSGGSGAYGGGVLVRGGNNSSTNATSAGGSLVLSAGASSGASTPGSPGLLLIEQQYNFTGTYAQFGTLCFTTGAMTVTPCGTSVYAGFAGVALYQPAAGLVVAAVGNSIVPILATSAVTAGHTVCTNNTANKITDSGYGSFPCPTGPTIGFVSATSYPTTALYADANIGAVTVSTTLPLVQMESYAGPAVTSMTSNSIPKSLSSAGAQAIFTPSSLIDNTDVVTTEPLYAANGNQLLGTTATSIATTTYSTTGIAFPATYATTARTYRGMCIVAWEQATGVATVKFGIGASVAPTHESLTSVSAIGTTAIPFGTGTTDITSTTTTDATAFLTPSASATMAITTIYVGLSATAAANTLTLYGQTSNASDALLIEPGTICTWL